MSGQTTSDCFFKFFFVLWYSVLYLVVDRVSSTFDLHPTNIYSVVEGGDFEDSVYGRVYPGNFTTFYTRCVSNNPCKLL